MDLVPRLLGIALAGLVLAGSSGAALAGGTTPADAGTAPSLLTDSMLLPAADNSSFTADQQSSDRQNGHLDFFSARPVIHSEDFTSLLGNSANGGGLALHWNW